MSETIIGIGIFEDSTINNGTVTTGVFDDSAVNSGITTNASFSGSSTNTGTVIENAVFTETSVNEGTVADAVFTDTSTNAGSVTGAVVFTGTTINTGVISGPVVFSENSVNTGTVAEATFIGYSQNNGTVTLSATFAEQADNNGTVEGDALFFGNSVNTGTISGNANIIEAYQNGTVLGNRTENVQPDGAYAWGYFSGGAGAMMAPPSYSTVVYQVGSLWYKYDANGSGALASGNYSDGTSMFTFANGVKGAAYNAPAKNGAYSDGYYVNDVINTLYTNLTPQLTQDTGMWVVYANENVYLAIGSYSNGYYNSGVLETGHNDSNANIAQDSGNPYVYYTYVGGVAVIAAGWLYGANGQAAAYYINGSPTNLDSGGNTPVDPVDGSYTPYDDKVWNAGNPYTGPAYYLQDEYGNPTMRIDFVDGVEVYNGPNV